MKIIENQEKYADDFIRLNEEWISTHFKIEAEDRKLAANPMKIVDDGGFIFTLISGQDVVGVCALFNEDGGVYELARMAVPPSYHGRGYGNQLMHAVLSKLRGIQANKVFLISNTKLSAAISMYKKHGFTTVSLGQHPIYSRANIVMERSVS